MRGRWAIVRDLSIFACVGLVINDEFMGSSVVVVLATHVWTGLSLIGL
jgi:hypothetical protein